MTAHSLQFTDWKPGDPIPEGFAEELAECVLANKRMGMACFANLCPADNIIWVLWQDGPEPPPDNPWHEGYQAVKAKLKELEGEGDGNPPSDVPTDR